MPASQRLALRRVGYWQTVASILTVSGAFYAFVIQRFEGQQSEGQPLFAPDELER